MVSLDTNVLVRIFTNDDPEQAKKALSVIRKNMVYISRTVLLETEWVLRYSYQLDSDAILNSFRKLIGLENVRVEKLSQVLQALECYEAGMDFADALHLFAEANLDFISFDKKLFNKASQLGKNNVILLK